MKENGNHHGAGTRNNNLPQVPVTVIIPTLNEAENLPLVLPYIPMEEISEVILVDGRSTDDTVEVAKKLLPSIKVILETRPGKGIALRRAYEEATGEILVVMDADGSNDPREIPRFVRALLEGADFVKGSRFAPQGGTTDMPRIRKMGNATFVHMVNFLFGSKFTDLCYGYHAFWRHCLDCIDLSSVDGFEIDTAIYLQALRRRLKIIDIPSFEGYRFYGTGKLQTIPDGWRVLKTILHEWVESIQNPATEFEPGFRGVIPAARAIEPTNGFSMAFNFTNPAIRQPGRGETTLERMYVCLELLYTISRGLSERIRLYNLLEKTLQLTLESLGATSGSLVVLDEQGNPIEGHLIFRGRLQSLSEMSLAEILDDGLAGWVLRNEEPALVESTQEDPRWLLKSWEENERRSRSALGVPLKGPDRVYGVLTMVGGQNHPFTEEDLWLVSQKLVATTQ